MVRQDSSLQLMSKLSEDSTLALGGESTASMDSPDYLLCKRVDLITTTLGSKPPKLPLREERLSLGVETVFKAKGVGWQGVRKKYKKEKDKKGKNELRLHSPYVISWKSCAGSRLMTCVDNGCCTPFSHKNMIDDVDAFKALTYEEYLEYLKRCQEKMKIGENIVDLEMLQELKDSFYGRQSILSEEIDDARDDRYRVHVSQAHQELREIPSTLLSTSIASLPSEEMKTANPRRRVSFGNADQVQNIPGCKPSKNAGGMETQTERLEEENLETDTFQLTKETKVTSKQKKREHRTDNSIMKPPATDTFQYDELSPRSQLNASRALNLLDQMYIREESTTSHRNYAKKEYDDKEVDMLKRALMETKQLDAQSIQNQNKGSHKDDTSSPAVVMKSYSIEISPSGKSAAADLARRLVEDIENLASSDEATEFNTSTTLANRWLVPIIHHTSSSKNENVSHLIKDDTALIEDRHLHKIESLGLAREILEEIQTSLIMRSSSIDLTNPKSLDGPTQSSVKLSPLGQNAAADLSRSLLEDVENLTSGDKAYYSSDNEYNINTNWLEGVVDLSEERELRNMASSILTEKIIKEIQVSLEEQEKEILGYSQRSSKNLEEQENHNLEVSQRSSSITWGKPEIRTIAITNHPAELAQRRAQDIRNRQQEYSNSICTSKSQESEDSWSQPNNINGLNQGQGSWTDENESFSVSSVEKFASSSAELARRLIEEATYRHNKIAHQLKSLEENGLTWPNDGDDSTIKNPTCCSEDQGRSINITELMDKQEQTAISRDDQEPKCDKELSDDQSKESQSMDSFESSCSYDSMDNISDVDGESIKQSTDLAKNLLENAKLRLQQVKTSPVSSVVNYSEQPAAIHDQELATEKEETLSSQSSESMNDSSATDNESNETLDANEDNQCSPSADIAKRLLREAFNQNQDDCHFNRHKLSVIHESNSFSPSGSGDEPKLQDDKPESNQVIAKIMDKAGFGDLFSSSSEKGSFDQLISFDEDDNKYDLDFDYERWRLYSIKEEEGPKTSKRPRSAITTSRIITPKTSKAPQTTKNDEDSPSRKRNNRPETSTSNTIASRKIISSYLPSTKKASPAKASTNDIRSSVKTLSPPRSKTLKTPKTTNDDKPKPSYLSPTISSSKKKSSHIAKSVKSPQNEEENGLKRNRSKKPAATAELDPVISAKVERLKKVGLLQNGQRADLKKISSSNDQEKRNDDETTDTRRHEDETNESRRLNHDDCSVEPSASSPQQTITPVSTEYEHQQQNKTNDTKINFYSDQEFDYCIPRSFSMDSCNSGSDTSGFTMKSTPSIYNNSAQFEIEESISMTVNELKRISSMLEDAESSCHSSQASIDDQRDILFFAKQTKQEIAALAKAIDNKVKAEESHSFQNNNSLMDYAISCTDDISSYGGGDEFTISSNASSLRTAATRSVKSPRSGKSPAMDLLIKDVNDLCNQIESRIDNIVSDTQGKIACNLPID